jgi:hypothetical protein
MKHFSQSRKVDLPKAMRRILRQYRYLAIPKQDRENPHLVWELVKCGKMSCRCAEDTGHRHGPYTYLRYEEYDPRTGETHYRREYVPASEVARVRRWIRRARAASGRSRAIMGLLRRYAAGVEARARRRARLQATSNG